MTLPIPLPADADLTKWIGPVSEGAEAGRDLDGTLERDEFDGRSDR